MSDAKIQKRLVAEAIGEQATKWLAQFAHDVKAKKVTLKFEDEDGVKYEVSLEKE